MGALAVASEVIELNEFLDHFALTATLDALRHAAMQVILEDQGLQLLDGFADGVRLAQDIHAILVVLDHLADAAQVPLDIVQPLDDISLVGAHRSLLYPYPLGRGSGDSIAHATSALTTISG